MDKRNEEEEGNGRWGRRRKAEKVCASLFYFMWIYWFRVKINKYHILAKFVAI